MVMLIRAVDASMEAEMYPPHGEEDRRVDNRRAACKDCPLIDGYCREHVVMTSSWKWRVNLMIWLLGILLAGTGGLLWRIDSLGDNVHGVVTGLNAHLREFETFETRVYGADTRLWEDIRELRRKTLQHSGTGEPNR